MAFLGGWGWLTLVVIAAPAKLNLTLEVLGRRSDGYHEIRSLVQTVSLYDHLQIEKGNDITIRCDLPGWSADRSLVSRAVAAMKQKKGDPGGVCISITKRIPLMCGLGGDSSAAAAVLRGLNEVWEVGLGKEELVSLGLALGSDVPLFFYGGTLLVEGRGEKVTVLGPMIRTWMVLVVPDVSRQAGKTGRMYASLLPGHFTDGSITSKAIEISQKEKRIDSSLLFNTFENIACDVFPGLKVYQEHLLKLGAQQVHLAGSGPALYAVFDGEEEASDFHRRCQAQRIESYLVHTL